MREKFQILREEQIEIGILAGSVRASKLRADRQSGNERQQKKQQSDGELPAPRPTAARFDIARVARRSGSA